MGTVIVNCKFCGTENLVPLGLWFKNSPIKCLYCGEIFEPNPETKETNHDYSDS